MMRAVIGLATFLTLTVGLLAPSANAASIGVLPAGSSYSDVIQSTGPTFSRDYAFELQGSANLTVLATAFAQASPMYGVDLLEIALYDSGSNLIASASGSPIAWLDSFAQSGGALGAGAYLFTVFGDVTAGKQAFVSISLAANNVVPIPAAGIMLLTALGALGGAAAWRRRRAEAGAAS